MKLSRKTLKNGLNVFMVNVPDAQSVVFCVMVKAGSRHEGNNNSGVAHFLEHVFFKGSQNHPRPTDITSTIDAIGGEMNAYTTKEFTEYYIKAEKNHFDLIFEVLTDMIQNPLFPEVELEKEKGVIIEEINMYQDSPGWQVDSNLDKIMWPGTKLGREILGTKKSVAAMTRAQVFDFKEKFYAPNNMILGVAGSFNERDAFAKIKRFWSTMDRNKIPAVSKAADGQREPGMDIENKKTQQTHLALGFKSFPHGHKNNVAVFLMASILGGSFSSRLWINIREQKGLAYHVHASDTPYIDTGSFTITAGLKTTSALDALKEILGEIRKLKSDLVTEIELKRAKDYVKGKIALSLEDNQEQLNWLMARFAFGSRYKNRKELFKSIDAVKAGDILKVANTIFRNDKASLAVIGPYKDKKAFQKEMHIKGNF